MVLIIIAKVKQMQHQGGEDGAKQFSQKGEEGGEEKVYQSGY